MVTQFDAIEVRSDQGRIALAYLAAPCVCGSSMVVCAYSRENF